VSEEISLRVDVPDVVVEPYRFEVRCGETTAYVHEHGVQSSGTWSAWLGASGGYAIPEHKDMARRTQLEALADAREYVAREERRRVAYAKLVAALKVPDGD
jgi:hypothetical protein